MKNQKRSLFRDICLFSGIVLLAAALVTLFFWQWGIRDSAERATEAVAALRTVLPEAQGAVPEARRDNSMPVLSLEGEDYIGILEIPAFGSALPVGARWGNSSRYPCRFSGSVYDRSIRIGATSQAGQYDFYRDISVGNALYFTDMTGSCYRYEIAEIQYREHADDENLISDQSDLTVFVKNLYAFNEYIILHCTTQK
jgi:sortase A